MHQLMNRRRTSPTGPEEAAPIPGAPRWVKVAGIITLALVLLAGGLMLFGGGQHGPGRHAPGGGQSPDGQTSPIGDTKGTSPSGGKAGAHTAPPGGHR